MNAAHRLRNGVGSHWRRFLLCSRSHIPIHGKQTAQNSLTALCDLPQTLLRKTPSLRLACFLYNGCDIDTASMLLVGTNLPGQAVPLSSERNGALRLSA